MLKSYLLSMQYINGYRAMCSASIRVKKEDIYLHPDLEFWTYTLS